MPAVSTPTPARRPRTARALLAALALALTVAGSALAQAAPQPSPRPALRSSGAAASQLFHISMVKASREPGGPAQGKLPAGIAKALADLKDFLPYQGYQVVDSSLVRASDEFHTRLSGPDGLPYQVDAVFVATENGQSYLSETFALHRVVRMEELAREMERGRAVTPHIAPMPDAPGLTASFRIARGETVVVGSSRLEGRDDALIVLLTAVP